VQKSSPKQFNAVLEKIQETVANNPDMGALRNHVGDIAREFAAKDAFDFDNEGRLKLSYTAWHDWLFTGGDKKYLE